jgi:hypothetical protein
MHLHGAGYCYRPRLNKRCHLLLRLQWHNQPQAQLNRVRGATVNVIEQTIERPSSTHSNSTQRNH